MITDSRYTEFVRKLFVNRNSGSDGALHATIGMAGESGELLDAIKKNWVYGKPLDRANVIEELGDFEWYAEALRQVIGVSRDFIHSMTMLDGSKEEYDALVLVGTKAPLLVYSTGLSSIASQCAACAAIDSTYGEIDDPEVYAHMLGRMDVILSLLYAELVVTRDFVLQQNIAKLEKRYPGGYTNEAAIARADKQFTQEYPESQIALGRAGYVL